ncbi:MAG: hypothetical protein V3V15_00405, partial [Sphingorhabdus sp.]
MEKRQMVAACLMALLVACSPNNEKNEAANTDGEAIAENARPAEQPVADSSEAEKAADKAIASADAEPKTDASTKPGKIADCMITSTESGYEGGCRFVAEKGGSFSVSRDDGSNIVDDVVIITVAVIGSGKAEVRGLTKAGINSRW